MWLLVSVHIYAHVHKDMCTQVSRINKWFKILSILLYKSLLIWSYITPFKEKYSLPLEANEKERREIHRPHPCLCDKNYLKDDFVNCLLKIKRLQ